MQKKLLIIVVSLLFIVGVLYGCTKTSDTGLDNSENIKHIMGSWINISFSVNSSGANESTMRIYNFTNGLFNYSYNYTRSGDNHYYYYFAAGTYELNDGTLIISNSTTAQYRTFNYSFSNNYQILTLTDDKGHSIVYSKFQNPTESN